MKKPKEYAIYKGEQCVGIGTIKELAKDLGVKESTIYFYTMPVHHRRCRNGKKRTVAIALED